MRHPITLSAVASALLLLACSIANKPAPPVGADCPAATNGCGAGLCRNRSCQLVSLEVNTPSMVQPGSCRYAICDGNGNAVVEHFEQGTSCDYDGGQVCDGKGSCVACVVEQDCAAGQSCRDSYCVTQTCSDALLNGDETDVDCGGACAPCGPGKLCVDASDCLSEVCSKLEGERLCDLPRCNDGVQNASESDIDCGGGEHPFTDEVCTRCQQDQHCQDSNDCEEGLECDEQRCVLNPLKDNPQR